MRRYVIAGNWKMNKTPNGAKALIEEMKPLVAGTKPSVQGDFCHAKIPLNRRFGAGYPRGILDSPQTELGCSKKLEIRFSCSSWKVSNSNW